MAETKIPERPTAREAALQDALAAERIERESAEGLAADLAVELHRQDSRRRRVLLGATAGALGAAALSALVVGSWLSWGGFAGGEPKHADTTSSDGAAKLTTPVSPQPDPHAALAFADRARDAIDQSSLDEAEILLARADSALRPGPADPQVEARVLATHARLYRWRDHAVDAIDACNAALTLYPTSAPALFERGLMEMHIGDRTRACADLTRALQLEPLDRDARVARTASAQLGCAGH